MHFNLIAKYLFINKNVSDFKNVLKSPIELFLKILGYLRAKITVPIHSGVTATVFHHIDIYISGLERTALLFVTILKNVVLSFQTPHDLDFKFTHKYLWNLKFQVEFRINGSIEASIHLTIFQNDLE